VLTTRIVDAGPSFRVRRLCSLYTVTWSHEYDSNETSSMT